MICFEIFCDDDVVIDFVTPATTSISKKLLADVVSNVFSIRHIRGYFNPAVDKIIIAIENGNHGLIYLDSTTEISALEVLYLSLQSSDSASAKRKLLLLGFKCHESQFQSERFSKSITAYVNELKRMSDELVLSLNGHNGQTSNRNKEAACQELYSNLFSYCESFTSKLDALFAESVYHSAQGIHGDRLKKCYGIQYILVFCQKCLI